MFCDVIKSTVSTVKKDQGFVHNELFHHIVNPSTNPFGFVDFAVTEKSNDHFHITSGFDYTAKSSISTVT